MQVIPVYVVANSTLGSVRDYVNAQGKNPPLPQPQEEPEEPPTEQGQNDDTPQE